jgi:hypothetical protein
MGGKYVQQLQNDVTHLLVGTPEGDKFEKARLEDSITLVSPLWVGECWVRNLCAQSQHLNKPC